jgi:hypothetical protein
VAISTMMTINEVFTNVFKKVDGVWETVWGHRSLLRPR